MTVRRAPEVIWMPYAYRARVLGKPLVFSARLPVAPASATWAEAPIAAVAGDEVFRHRDGTWLRPVRLPSGDVARMSELLPLLAAPPREAVAWTDYPLFDAAAGLPQLPFADGVEAEDAVPAGRVLRASERGLREGYATAAAAGLVVMQGVLWRACPEPHLVVRAEGRGMAGRISVAVALRPDPEADAAFFRIDAADEAAAHAAALARDHNKDKPAGIAVEVRTPGAVAFDPARAMAERISWALKAKRRQAWLDPKELAGDPAAAEMGRILAAVDLHVPGGDPLPVLAATAAFLKSERGHGRYGAFLRKGHFQIMEPQILRWAASRSESLAMSAEEDAAIAGIAPSP